MNFAYLKDSAKANLTGQWGAAIGILLLQGIVQSVPSLFVQFSENYTLLLISYAVSLALLPLQVGYVRFFLLLAQGGPAEVGDLFSGFQGGRYGRNLGTLLLMSVMIFLWFLLLIIPGIIKSFAYAMTPYILADEDYEHLSGMDVLRESEQMMNGRKMDFFVLGLSFIGWILVIIITCGLAAFYVSPYMSATFAEFYLEAKGTPSAPKAPPKDVFNEEPRTEAFYE